MNLKRWFHEHSLRLLAIRDTPESIAGGVAIGVFFGFMPLIGLKTASALLVAWLTRCNLIATVIAGTMHDLVFPLMPVIYLWQYKLGYFVVSNPHRWPTIHHFHPHGIAWRQWTSYFTGFGKPLLVGGLLFSAPFVPISFYVTRGIMARHQEKRREQESKAIKAAQEQGIEPP